MKKKVFLFLSLSFSITLCFSQLNNLDERFLYAIVYNNLETAKELLDKGADVNAKYPIDSKRYIGHSALHIAAGKYKASDFVKLLIEKGANIHDKVLKNDKYNSGATPLLIAVQRNEYKSFKHLIEAGANVNDKFYENDSDYPAYSALHTAIYENKSSRITQELIQKGADVNALTAEIEGKKGLSPLQLAAEGDISYKTVELLIEKGAKINIQNSKGETPLHSFCSGKENYKIVELLIKKGARINRRIDNVKNKYHGFTALLIAAEGWRNSSAIVKLLLEKGAKIHDKVPENNTMYAGHTALHLSSYYSNSKTVKYILDKGADIKALTSVKAQSYPAFTPFQIAVTISYNDELIKLLIENGADINKIIQSNKGIYAGMTPLLVACKKGKTKIVRYLIQKAVNVNSNDKTGKTALHYAAEKKTKNYSKSYWDTDYFYNMLDILISAGCDINAKDKNGETPLIFAAAGKNTENIKLLIYRKADIKIKNNAGKTVLQIAKEKDNTEVIEALKTKKFDSYFIAQYGRIEEIQKIISNKKEDINKPDRSGLTMLNYAIVRNENSLEAVKMLITAGASVNTHYLNMLDISVMNSEFDLMKYLLAKNPGMNPIFPLDIAIRHRKIDIIKYLLENGLKINERNNHGYSVWHYALFERKNYNTEMIKLFIKYGLDVNIRDNFNKKNSLFCAIMYEDLDLAKYLVKKGADVNNKNRYDDTPLIHCIQYKENNELALFLIKNGADVNLPDKEGITPLKHSKDRGRKEITKALLKKGATYIH